ncbi:hypothetical protein [Lewinella sp. W8]|uniref:hypothetical protein n=1 Tax=Lewinella sp. W8 TaxID=2528208 RepID=UPI001067A7CA|nr:hypothetical protein [Lewinella sp. W8]MTB53921.1 hypothetical protein [Lewinella sp. W8]
MKSKANLIGVVEQLKADAHIHGLTKNQVESLDDIIDALRAEEKRDTLKDVSEITLNVVNAIKLIVEWLGNTS